MLIVNPFERCKFADKCQYADSGTSICYGNDENRDYAFTCMFCDKDGNIKPNKYRNFHDRTGTMKVILE